MLRLGNTKLGFRIWQWSIPPIRTCPGRSELCERYCYGRKTRLATGTAIRAHRRNLRLAQGPEFTGWMAHELHRVVAEYLRLHVVGDFFDPAYTQKWVEILQRAPGTVVSAYTRSWRVPEILPALRSLARQPNMRLWLSCDRETGAPPAIRRARRAYMMVDDQDAPRFRIDLAFRVHRQTILREIGGRPVCPHEAGGPRPDSTCSHCLHCYEI